MKFLNSIKWRLQLWYGLILLVVLAGFGGLAFQLERGQQLRRVDDELQRRQSVLANLMRRQTPRMNRTGMPGDGNLPPRQGFGGPPPDNLPPETPDDTGPRRGLRPFVRFQLPPEQTHLFDAADPDGFYYLIRKWDGAEISRSSNAPSMAEVFTAPEFDVVEERNGRPPMEFARMEPPRMRNRFREQINFLPSGDVVLVGKSLRPELKAIRMTAWKLGFAGGGILLLGLAGGWWMVRRSLRPIAEIGAAAAKISAGDLSQRINISETKSELGELAAVLNSTFERLESAFAQQKQFASDAAHELRTPVTVILTQTQTALARERDAASYRQTVEACQRAAQRMRKLIESLLELARFDAGQEVLKRLSFDLALTTAECAEMVRPLADERVVKINTRMEPMEIVGDSERLSQVITNLLTNAIQYNRSSGEVNVTLGREPGLAVLTIADTGQGISPDNLPRVFERFYRADKSRTGAGNSGLGLSICRAIISAHGGTVEVSSEQDVGTTFTVRLPADLP